MNQNPNREVGDREPRGERPLLSPIHTLVVSLAAIGLPAARIAHHLGLAEHTLLRHFATELAQTGSASEIHVQSALSHMAKSHRHPGVTQSWLKPRLPKPQKESEFPPMDDTKVLEFNVYCNDGEPNHPY